jgi:hypothetical protein
MLSFSVLGLVLMGISEFADASSFNALSDTQIVNETDPTIALEHEAAIIPTSFRKAELASAVHLARRFPPNPCARRRRC